MKTYIEKTKDAINTAGFQVGTSGGAVRLYHEVQGVGSFDMAGLRVTGGVMYSRERGTNTLREIGETDQIYLEPV